MTKVKISNITINLDNKRKPLNGEDRSKISIEKKYPYCGANNIMDYVDEYLFDEEIICIAEDGGKWGADETCSYIMNEKCWINNHAHVLKVLDTNCTDIRYLKYWLNHKDLNGVITGAIVKKLTQKALNDIEIDIPSIEEQRNISNKLDTISNLIEYKKNQILKLNELIKSQFVEMFGDPLVNDGMFEMKLIKQIGKVVSGATPKTNNDEFGNGNNIWVTPAELNDNSFVISDSERKITDLGVKSCAVNLLPKNTVILSSRAPIGKTAIAGVDMYCNQGFKNIIPSNEINSIYLYELLKNKTEYLNSLGRGATFKEISKEIVENIKIKVPPIVLQNKFAQIVEQIDKQKFVNLKIFQLLGKKLKK